MFQPHVIVRRNPLLHLHGRLHAALRLLHDVPCFVRQMLLLPRRNMDVTALGVGQSVEFCGLG